MNPNRARIVPSLHHRKEGWLRHQENFAKQPKQTQSGWFSFCFYRKTTPASRSVDASQYFLIAQPPLLAAMQGGDYRAPFQFLHTFFSQRSFLTRTRA